MRAANSVGERSKAEEVREGEGGKLTSGISIDKRGKWHSGLFFELGAQVSLKDGEGFSQVNAEEGYNT